MSQGQKTTNQWRQELLTALEHFWSGDDDGADAIFSGAIRQLSPLITSVEQPARSDERNQMGLQALRHLYALATLGHWAVGYRVDRRRSQHPAIAPDLLESVALWRFVVDVYLAQEDVGEDALKAYVAHIAIQGKGERAIRIARILLRVPATLAVVRLLEALYDLYPDDPHIATYLCAHYLQEEQWEKASEIARRRYQQNTNDRSALEVLAYTAEQTQDWERRTPILCPLE